MEKVLTRLEVIIENMIMLETNRRNKGVNRYSQSRKWWSSDPIEHMKKTIIYQAPISEMAESLFEDKIRPFALWCDEKIKENENLVAQ